MSTIKEIWKDIPGYKGYYMVSNLGNVKSLDRYQKGNSKHFGLIRRPGKLLAKNKQKGYLSVTLSKNGKAKIILIHRLVAMTFIRMPKHKEQVNHKNGVKTDNRLENLEWLTQSENQLHRFRVLGHEESTKKAIRCTTLNIESDSIMGLNDKLMDLGISSKTSYSVLAKYSREKGDNFYYKGLEFEMIANE